MTRDKVLETKAVTAAKALGRIHTLGDEAAGVASAGTIEDEFVLEPWHGQPGCYVVFGDEECLFVGASLSSAFKAAMQQRVWEAHEREEYGRVVYRFYTVGREQVMGLQAELLNTYHPKWGKKARDGTLLTTVSPATGRPKDKRGVEEKEKARKAARAYAYSLHNVNVREVEREEIAKAAETTGLQRLIEELEGD